MIVTTHIDNKANRITPSELKGQIIRIRQSFDRPLSIK